jgi:hypothetical protein
VTSRSVTSRSGAMGSVWQLGYVAEFLLLCGWRPGCNSVDLTHGKLPAAGCAEFSVKKYAFTPEETEQALQRCRSLRLTVSQAVCAALAEALFAAQPDKSRACISVPTDLGPFLPEHPRTSPGNYTGSLIVQLRRGTALEIQIRRAFRWLSRGIDYWLPRTLGALALSERALSETFARTAALPIPERGPFENLSCAMSNLGTIQLPVMRRQLHSISVTGRTQTILVCVVSLNGRMSVEVSAARSLFDPAEVFGVTDRAVAQLLGGPLETVAK